MTQPAAPSTSTEDGQLTTGAPTSGTGDEPKSITMTTQQLADRLARAKPADYDDLKAKAARLDQIEQANKSEIEKASEGRQKAEQERDVARAEALRFKIASKNGITDEDAELFLTGTDEATITRQAAAFVDRTSARRRQGNTAPREGSNQQPASDNMRELARKLFNPRSNP